MLSWGTNVVRWILFVSQLVLEIHAWFCTAVLVALSWRCPYTVCPLVLGLRINLSGVLWTLYCHIRFLCGSITDQHYGFLPTSFWINSWSDTIFQASYGLLFTWLKGWFWCPPPTNILLNVPHMMVLYILLLGGKRRVKQYQQ